MIRNTKLTCVLYAIVTKKELTDNKNKISRSKIVKEELEYTVIITSGIALPLVAHVTANDLEGAKEAGRFVARLEGFSYSIRIVAVFEGHITPLSIHTIWPR
ncbi:MAG: hypothetical protein NUV65_06875 [Candidatus Roizmanbacteria bacterium]|nr:hypothetical protein [Candidatus Roizmanbacteria bacterium]